MFAIMKRELLSQFTSPLGYVFIAVLPVFGDISVFVHIDVPIGGYELRLYGNVFCNAYHDPHTDNEAYGGGK